MFVEKADGASVFCLESQISVGKTVLIINPTIENKWGGVSVIGTRHPLWPVEQPAGTPQVALPLNVAEETRPLAFDLELANVEVDDVRMAEACGQSFCDGRYGVACPSTRHGAPQLTLPVVVLRAGDVQFAPYCSVDLARQMFGATELLTSAGSTLDICAMADHVEQQLSGHVGGVRLWGWLKPAVRDGDDFATLANLRASRLAVLEAPLERYVAAAAVRGALTEEEAAREVEFQSAFVAPDRKFV